ncbi:FAD dependent oxidoreductase [Annulohypoxylon truncatum]|uniref:FAD dependent oxidoreductase n=1 Tax=Annulohypoxylon truncatum TaxID=327061 RepID=UPI002007672F|nr:FAD dependent oxidoreductase [Annulohypoxylon truncatum]KAI1210182.1 FAD dependent oxidoreductase [Annulohypoxylon truncatum]
MDKQASILILGAGTFGLSTAYHLAKAGYTNVTVLEKSATFPPELSAGNDLNKIIRAEYEDPFYAELALEAMNAWKSPLFTPYYHETGYLLCNSAGAPEKSKISLQKSLDSIRQRPEFENKITPVNSRDDIRKVAPAFDGPMLWKGYFNSYAGYAHAADAMTAVYSACIALGVTIHLNSTVQNLTYSDSGDICTGAMTTKGTHYTASTTILTLGASLASILPQIKRQIIAKGSPVAHIQLTPREAAQLRGIPVTYARDLGFFFEPDVRTQQLKLCPANAGYTHYHHHHATSSGLLSLPPSDNSFVAARDEAAIRRLLRETLPELAERPLVGRRVCWCADTADSEYVIDFVPGKKGLVVVTGDSAHAFKMLPTLGAWVREVLERGRQDRERWRWKEGSDAAGVDISWRVGKTTDLQEVRDEIRRDEDAVEAKL